MINLLYLAAAICFILALKELSSADGARRGNFCGMAGMAAAVSAACVGQDTNVELGSILQTMAVGGAIGVSIAQVVAMKDLPQMIAGFHSLIGLAAALISFSVYWASRGGNLFWLLEIGVGSVIGIVTFSGSITAFLKLHCSCKECGVSNKVNFSLLLLVLLALFCFIRNGSEAAYVIAVFCSFILGGTLILPIGGGDMPVIVSMLNSLSGWAASGIGFTIHNELLIITGALVGASGTILSYIMCRSMNRSFRKVLFKPSCGKILQNVDTTTLGERKAIKRWAPEDAAFVLKNATSVIVVPGYGMATSQAQHALKEMGEALKKLNVRVRYAIHPVAGRMPGHMNVLLAEANVPYEDVFALEDINLDFPFCDVAYVIGANDVTNPAAKKDPTSPIYGMPIVDVERAKVVLFLKRSMGAGYAGIDNELFYSPNSMMLLGDAKETTAAIVKEL
ncbi:MAG: NAD(P)(+) transhydrogenase (Re/Si-specific) subunit beta [Holosporaceae bacterium]|jgi:NAD(P) transhydrogenase subunit beta|nr:NAD(P)(+) transhydrogenase (Re/Si-specific) subunit beta [Holosporaceae bacterium]